MVEFVIFLGLVGLGLTAGTLIQRRHFRLLEEREAANGDFLITQLRSYPGAVRGPSPPMLVCGEAVISSDYLKTLLGSLRKIFGGELRSFRSLVERARREALQRIVEQARAQGYNAICNVRFESSDIVGAAKARRAMVVATILASATAYHCRQPSATP